MASKPDGGRKPEAQNSKPKAEPTAQATSSCGCGCVGSPDTKK